MDDKTLLEDAAKFSGIVDLKFWRTPVLSGWIYDYKDAYDFKRWNPLENDGDALRLAKALKMIINFDNNMVDFVHPVVEWDWSVQDPCIRRAIVRAAAEIGRHSHG